MNPNESCTSLAIEPVFEKPTGANFNFQGFVGKRADVNLEVWLLKAPIANPAMLQMFRDSSPLGRGQGWVKNANLTVICSPGLGSLLESI